MPEGVKSPHPIEVTWEGGKRFRGGVPGFPMMLMDGRREAAPSPVDGMVVAVGACSGIDLVDYLEKRRTPAIELGIRVEFSRAPEPPRRLTHIQIHYRVVTDAEYHHVIRALELSHEKYCSVSASLAADTEIGWTAEVFSPTGEQVVG